MRFLAALPITIPTISMARLVAISAGGPASLAGFRLLPSPRVVDGLTIAEIMVPSCPSARVAPGGCGGITPAGGFCPGAGDRIADTVAGHAAFTHRSKSPRTGRCAALASM